MTVLHPPLPLPFVPFCCPVVLGYVSVEPWDPARRVFPLHQLWHGALPMLRMRNCRQRPPSADKARTVNKTLEPELGSQWGRRRPREPHVTARGSPESERSRRAGPTYGRSPYPPATTSPRRVLSPLLPRARRRGSGPAAPRRTARARGGRSPARRRGRASPRGRRRRRRRPGRRRPCTRVSRAA